jgi:hypothetical protein
MIFCARATRGLRWMRGSRQTVLLARRAPTIKRWSLDARSEEQSAYSLWGSWGVGRPSLDARSGGLIRAILGTTYMSKIGGIILGHSLRHCLG